MSKCLVCFHEVDNDTNYHTHCCRRLFNAKEPLILDFGLSDLKELANKSVATQTNITGVQAKISLSPAFNAQGIGKLAVDYKGTFILKPPSKKFLGIAEVEAATMQMAEEVTIGVVPHGLIKMKDGAFAYITRRMDRANNTKTPQEDLCQLSERLTEDKYKSSCERVGKVIKKYADFPKIAAIDYFKLVVFNFIHGNNDMHMKNYSMSKSNAGMHLSLAYDLLNSSLLNPLDTEESALTINGKKSNLKKADFDFLANSIALTETQKNNVYRQLFKAKGKFESVIDRSMLTAKDKEAYLLIMNKNYKALT